MPEALRACGKRNERAARHLRSIEKECRVFPALSKQELTKQRARRIRSLNLDIGLLYAASVVADSKALSANRVLPGAAENWRTRHAFYAKAVNEVGKMYDRYHKCGKVVANLLIHEPFLAKLKERASRVF